MEGKYRALTERGEWVYGWLDRSYTDRPCMWVTNGRRGNPIPIISSTVGEYLGITDKNDFDVYEGDVLRSVHFIADGETHYLFHLVVWDAEWFLWKVVSIGNKDKKLTTNGNCMLRVYLKDETVKKHGFEVTGNIHQDIEILKGQTNG